MSSAPSGFLDPDNSTAAALLSSVELFAPHQSWNVEVQPQLSFFFKSGNALSLTYRYEFMGFARPELMMQSSGVWILSLKTKLK